MASNTGSARLAGRHVIITGAASGIGKATAELFHAEDAKLALIDRDGKRYLDKGLKYSAPTGPRIEQALVDDPLLLRTPIVRSEGRATVGYVPDVWAGWLG